MERYMIVSPHTADECQKVFMTLEATGFITHFDWGCNDGEHCGWAVIEADTPAEALMVVPAFQRNRARAIKLMRFSPQDAKKLHKKK